MLSQHARSRSFEIRGEIHLGGPASALGVGVARRFAPHHQVLDLRVGHAALGRHALVLVPFVRGIAQLRATQDHQFAQRA